MTIRVLKPELCSICGNETGKFYPQGERKAGYKTCEFCVTFNAVEDEINEYEGESYEGCCPEPCYHVTAYGTLREDEDGEPVDVELEAYDHFEYDPGGHQVEVHLTSARRFVEEDGDLVYSHVPDESECCNCGASAGVREYG